ncbi:hypothetical protein HKT18_09855 [Flavobacterium sp. IMCC34852]|uniref:Lipocalin-like domain-containing protein n=1 Tax=Flavobacterium rivulicola TaxID=2732161 RepID=A0A7Y3R9Q6_9FLAO|nr:hypothetical protein [Flavobacterium sp. IMCC34852]NNT72519.1 hypothetical protein [Flavobacterium sp. IMCC34852]
MKKIIISLSIMLLVFQSSCSNDSNTNPNTIQGQWKLVNVSGTFAGIDNDFEPGLITWDFNQTTQMVSIVNNNTDTDKWDVFETGVYNYQILEDPEFPCGEIIKIDGIDMGCFLVTNNSLVIDQSIADGFRLQFVE